MEIGILGLQASGKTTLFELLTGGSDSTASRRGGVAVGMAQVPDPRLEELSRMYSPRKTTSANIRLVDVPGVPAEHGRDGSLHVPELRPLDALMVVVRAFADPSVAHPMGSVDALRDLEHVETELVLQDLIVVERRLERLGRELARRNDPAQAAERALLERCRQHLEEGEPLRSMPLEADETRALRGFTFLSLKPLLVAVNADEDVVATVSHEPEWAPWRQRPSTVLVAVSARMEAELQELDPAERAAFLDDMGLAEPALERLAREAYRLLGYVSFYTVGEDECRAWSVAAGAPAVEAAAVIHSDISRGFIRAEVVPHDTLLGSGSLQACKAAGTLRLEGKQYPVRDGDVVHFRFAV